MPKQNKIGTLIFNPYSNPKIKQNSKHELKTLI